MPSFFDDTARRRVFLAAALAALTSVFSTYGVAQITKGSGSDSAESRASDSTQRANPSGNAVVESQAQSKDAAKGPQAGATKDRKTEGAGGFDNGLYGTGAGNNKK